MIQHLDNFKNIINLKNRHWTTKVFTFVIPLLLICTILVILLFPPEITGTPRSVFSGKVENQSITNGSIISSIRLVSGELITVNGGNLSVGKQIIILVDTNAKANPVLEQKEGLIWNSQKKYLKNLSFLEYFNQSQSIYRSNESYYVVHLFVTLIILFYFLSIVLFIQDDILVRIALALISILVLLPNIIVISMLIGAYYNALISRLFGFFSIIITPCILLCYVCARKLFHPNKIHTNP